MHSKISAWKMEIRMTTFESLMDFGEFKLNSDGLIPVVTQDYKDK